MDQVRILAGIRALVRKKFGQLGAPLDESAKEVMLIRHGCFCGRRFHLDGLQAVWFIEENEIKFYDRGGNIAGVVSISPENLSADPQSHRAA